MPTITAAHGNKIVEATADLTTDGYIGIPISITVFYDTAKNRVRQLFYLAYRNRPAKITLTKHPRPLDRGRRV